MYLLYHIRGEFAHLAGYNMVINDSNIGASTYTYNTPRRATTIQAQIKKPVNKIPSSSRPRGEKSAAKKAVIIRNATIGGSFAVI